MGRATIHDWTEAAVKLGPETFRDVKFKVYRDDGKHFLEIRDSGDQPVHTLELPDGMKLDRSSYEVLLRYVLLDVVAA